MRISLPLAGFLVLATAAFAQEGPPPDAPPPPPPPGQDGGPPPPPSGHHHVPIGQRFDAANTTHDGKLTLDQAQAAGLKMVVKHFAEIDTDHKGYVTKQDLKVFMQAMKARRAAMRSGQSGEAGGPPPGEGPPPGDEPPPPPPPQ